MLLLHHQRAEVGFCLLAAEAMSVANHYFSNKTCCLRSVKWLYFSDFKQQFHVCSFICNKCNVRTDMVINWGRGPLSFHEQSFAAQCSSISLLLYPWSFNLIWNRWNIPPTVKICETIQVFQCRSFFYVDCGILQRIPVHTIIPLLNFLFTSIPMLKFSVMLPCRIFLWRSYQASFIFSAPVETTGSSI